MFFKGVFVLFAVANITAGDIPPVEGDKRVGHKKPCCSSGFCPHSSQSFDFCKPVIRSTKAKGLKAKIKEEQSFLTQGQAPKSTTVGLVRKKKRKKRPVGTPVGTLEKDLNIFSEAPGSKLLTSTLLTEKTSLNVLDVAEQKINLPKADLETVLADNDKDIFTSIESAGKNLEFDTQEERGSLYHAGGVIDNEQVLEFLKTKRLKNGDTDTEEYQEEFFADEEDDEEDEINNENDSKIINILSTKKKKSNKTPRRHVI